MKDKGGCEETLREYSSLACSTVGVLSPLVFGKWLAQQKAACLPGRPISFPYESHCYVFETVRLALSQSGVAACQPGGSCFTS